MKIIIFIIIVFSQFSFSAEKFTFTASDLPKESIKNPFTEKTFADKLVVIDFWASWCTPCVESFSFYQEIQTKYKNKLIWFAISEDSTLEDAKIFLKDNTNTFHFYFDEEAKIAKKFNIIGIPNLFVLDTKGKILFEHKGFFKKEKEQILKKFETAMKQ